MKLLPVLPLMVVLAAVGSLRAQEEPAEQPGKTNLAALLAAPGPTLPPLGTTLELDPHWVGTVKRAYLRDLKGIYREDTPEDIRFTHLVVQPDESGSNQLVIARLRYDPDALLTSTDRHAPALRNNLPTIEDVAKATKFVDLTRLCGPPHGGTDVWGLSGTSHWTEEWTAFAPAGKDRLRYLNVFAHVSAPAAKGDQASRLDRTNAVVDILVGREGFFRPADPKSADERKRFLTADELFTRAQAERAKEREKYPQPLRALIEADETPDDDDQAAYVTAINQVRAKPEPLLFQQLVTWMNEEEVEMSSHLEDILCFDDPPPGLQPWKEGPRQAAVRALIEALAAARKPDALEEALMLVLTAQGGGKLKFSVPATAARIDLAARETSDGFERTHSCDGLSETNLAQVVAHCQTVLKQKYPELWPKPAQPSGNKSEQR